MRKTVLLSKMILLICVAGFVSSSISKTHSRSKDDSGRVRVAACQFPVSADISSNAIWIMEQMREAKQKGAEIVHFPECALSGYAGVDFDSLNDVDWDELHVQTEAILLLADELDLWVLLGSMHRLSDGHKPHNSLYVLHPDGRIIDRYDKRFCTSDDLEFYSPGDHFVVLEINGVRCGLLICYDIRFPELYRAYHQKGVQVIFQSFYNARQKPGSIHPIIMPITSQARAATNYFFMSITNSSAPLSWPCHFITPDGLIAQKLEADSPGILISTVDTGKTYYDASRPFRADAINGKLHSGQSVNDIRSYNRSVY